jgi:uncharacterized protein DUF1353
VDRARPEDAVLEDFGYIDPHGIRWPAPKGSIVDGASIPQVLSRVVGSASRAGGVGEQKAKLMDAAVYHFGPKRAPGGTAMFMMRTMPVEEEFAQLKTFVESGNPSLEEIEKFAPTRTSPVGTRPAG